MTNFQSCVIGVGDHQMEEHWIKGGHQDLIHY